MKMNGSEKSMKVLASMDEEDPSMVDEILNWRFTFEDVLRIDNNGVKMWVYWCL